MCLGVPGKIIDVYEADGLRMGKVDFGGVIKEVCLAYVPEAQPGNYAVIHVGFAPNVLNEAEALGTLKLLKQLSTLNEELGSASEQGEPLPSPGASGRSE
jgi:hydrogenase expression/formation protein HypC